MSSYLEFEVLPEVDDVLKLRVNGCSGEFSGSADCYVNESDFRDFCSALKGFPLHRDQKVQFDSGRSDDLSSFKISATCKNSSGHVLLDVRIESIVSFVNAPRERFCLEFFLVVEPAEIDRLQHSLESICNPGNVGRKAVARGKT